MIGEAHPPGCYPNLLIAQCLSLLRSKDSALCTVHCALCTVHCDVSTPVGVRVRQSVVVQGGNHCKIMKWGKPRKPIFSMSNMYGFTYEF